MQKNFTMKKSKMLHLKRFLMKAEFAFNNKRKVRKHSLTIACYAHSNKITKLSPKEMTQKIN